jgi:tripartite-type tricarboxylate transporter receptor subunit TctC
MLVGALAGAPVLLPLRLRAAGYPERPIHLIVPFAAGGNADIVGRLVGDPMGKALNGTVVVENRAGAGGSVGAEYVARANPDGYVLLVASNGPMTVNPFVQAKLGYDPLKDFAPLALTSYVPHALIMSNKSGAKSIADVIALSKQAPVTIASSGVGSASHMTLERFKHATGANITHVPYRSGGALLADLMSGAVQGAMTELSTALPQHTGKQAVIVAIASLQRSKLAPEVATFDESGVKGFVARSYIGIVAPAKTPAEIVAQLQQAIAKSLQPGSVTVEKLIGLGSEIATPEQVTSQGFAAFLRTDYEDMRQAAQLAGIVPQ